MSSTEQGASSLSALFVEIRPPPSKPTLPDRVQVYISRVKPQQCGPLIKDLRQCGCSSSQRNEAIAHLKRVKKCTTTPANNANGNDSPPTKKCKTDDSNVTLQVLLGLVSSTDETTKKEWAPLLTKYSTTLETCWVPGRPAESTEELQEFNKLWPTVYFHKQTQQHKQQELELTNDEVKEMCEGMQHAIDDATRAREVCGIDNDATSSLSCIPGAIIMCPVTHQVVATANDERKLQQQHGKGIPDTINPLCTSVLLAIQGVSRKEREAAVGYGMGSATFQKGQYLCTGYVGSTLLECCRRCIVHSFSHLLGMLFSCSYDLYTTREPGVYEAMALVHSRIRRVIFGVANHVDGGLGGTGMETAVQSLPTNHHYRAFSCAADSELFVKCKELHRSGNKD